MRHLLDLAGKRFGRLVAIERTRNGLGSVAWRCKCDCGRETTVKTGNLLAKSAVGHGTISCGCARNKGGLIHRGYREISVDGVWWFEHRYVMARRIGRPLHHDESVHHKNGNRADNRIQNLEIWVRGQPSGQRIRDLVPWAEEILRRYKPAALAQN